MKTSKDPRHLRRQEIVRQLFAGSFTSQGNLSPEVKKINIKSKKIDKKIEVAAPAWPIKNLNKIDLAILRLAIYELDNTKIPPKVVIDEAVELAKEFGSENSPSFVNGVLGTIYKERDKKDDQK